MAKQIINAVIERASDGGYGIYCPELNDLLLVGYGLTEKEAKENLRENVEECIFHYEELKENIPAILNNGDIDFEYRYDFSGFFKSYPMFNVTELAKYLGINPSLMRRYKQGLAFASDDQKKKIEKGVLLLANKLGAVKF